MKIFTLLIFILISQGIKSQEIMEAESGLHEYKYGDLYYRYEELGEVLKSNSYAYANYERSLSERKTSRILFITAGGVGLTTVIFAVHLRNRGYPRFSDVIYAMGTVTFIPIFSIAIAKNFNTKVHKRLSISIFNDGLFDMGEIDKYKHHSGWSMHFGQSQNGIGFVVQF